MKKKDLPGGPLLLIIVVFMVCMGLLYGLLNTDLISKGPERVCTVGQAAEKGILSSIYLDTNDGLEIKAKSLEFQYHPGLKWDYKTGRIYIYDEHGTHFPPQYIECPLCVKEKKTTEPTPETLTIPTTNIPIPKDVDSVEQQAVTVEGFEYQNFFFRPGHYGTLAKALEDGWIVKHIKDDEKNERAFVLFERVKK